MHPAEDPIQSDALHLTGIRELRLCLAGRDEALGLLRGSRIVNEDERLSASLVSSSERSNMTLSESGSLTRSG